MTWTQLWPRRLVAGVGSAVNWLAQTKPGLLLTTVLSAIAGVVSVGVNLTLSAIAARVAYVTTGVSAVVSAAGTVLADLKSGVALSTVLTGQTAAQTPAFDVVRMTVDLTGTYGASTSTNTTVSGSAWTTPANAVGVHNGTLAGHNGKVGQGDQTAYLDFTFPTFPNKSELTVTAAKLRFYAKQAGAIATQSVNFQYAWGTTAAPNANLVFDALATNVDHTTTPFEVDLYAAGKTSFAALEGLGARVYGAIGPLATGVQQSVDAVELVVTATRTDTL